MHFQMGKIILKITSNGGFILIAIKDSWNLAHKYLQHSGGKSTTKEYWWIE